MTLPLDPTFSDNRNDKSPLPQHKSNTWSPILALKPTIPILQKQNMKFNNSKRKMKQTNTYPLHETAILFHTRC